MAKTAAAPRTACSVRRRRPKVKVLGRSDREGNSIIIRFRGNAHIFISMAKALFPLSRVVTRLIFFFSSSRYVIIITYYILLLLQSTDLRHRRTCAVILIMYFLGLFFPGDCDTTTTICATPAATVRPSAAPLDTVPFRFFSAAFDVILSK